LVKNSSEPYLSYIAKSNIDNLFSPNLTTHNVTEIIYVSGGFGFVTIASQDFAVKKDDLLIINSNTLHGEFVKKNNYLDYHIIGIKNILFRFDKLAPINISVSPRIKYTIEQIYSEAVEKKIFSIEKVMFALGLLLITDINRLFQAENGTIRFRSNDELTNAVQQYLDENFSEEISLDLLTKKFLCNKNTLLHNFKKHIGMPIIQYLLLKRLEEAKLWLSISNQTISTIADMVGYSSPTLFNIHFKRNYNMTPFQYRLLSKSSKTADMNDSPDKTRNNSQNEYSPE
jgi:AraC-like DNA-binding protein